MIRRFLAAGALAALAACVAPFPDAGPPVGADASASMLAAWEASRVPGFAADPAAREAALAKAREALALAPGWAVPERFLDDWHYRPTLTAPARYGVLLERARGGDAAAAYLAGRLGGRSADDRIAAARAMEPRLGWAHHGLAWRTFSSGAPHRAIRGGQGAFTLAQDPAERLQFALALARYYRAADERTSAENLLRMTLAEEGALALRPSERASLEAELAMVELDSVDPGDVRRGAARGARIVADVHLDERERLSLLLALRNDAPALVTTEELELALLDARAGARTPAEDTSLRAALVALREGPWGLTGDAASWREALVAAFAAGEPLAALDAWSAVLPAAVRAENGGPARPALAGVLDAARALDGSAARAAALGDALIAAGWFDEARAWARFQGARDATFAADLERRAAAGDATLAAIRGLARRVDAHEAYVNSGAVGPRGAASREGGKLSSLRDLEDELERLTERVAGSTTPSPMIRYGPLGEVLHPGPVFSAEDERLGRGTAGEPVPGVAALFDRMGRFALVGRGVGQGGPDATILRLVGVEHRAGAHLGRPFEGTVFWCQGADVPGRYGRRGAAISGAALHEGYYVDLAMVENDRAGWARLRERFAGDPEALERALAVRGARVPVELRTETTPSLGAADRMRLALLVEGGADLPIPTIEELAHVVATHEEGHLCDRKQWYPLSFGRLLRLVGFAASHGFSSAAIGRALEARAQLVALCMVQDSRLAWLDLLDAAEAEGGASVTPHAAAYRGLLDDLLQRLEEEWRAGYWRDVDLDPERRWIDQLHRVPAEQLRGLAVREAREVGLAR